jgi:hypothetical protein
MAANVTVLKDRHVKASDVAAVHNALIKGIVDTGSALGATPVHYGKSGQRVTLADATDLATALLLVNHIRDMLYGDAANEILGHLNDDLVHKAIDTTNTVTAPKATNLATAITLANEIKADYNAHRSQSGVHPNNDAGNATASANATDQSSLNTLLNEIKADFNNHLDAGAAGSLLRATAL